LVEIGEKLLVCFIVFMLISQAAAGVAQDLDKQVLRSSGASNPKKSLIEQ
jgi:hypothetical protein